MKVLITGSSGMLGSAILKFLSTSEHDLLHPSHHILNLDDESTTNKYIELHHPDLIIHCAAKVGGISANIEQPSEFLTNNLRMDSAIFAAANKNEIKNLIYIASSCMYPRNLSHAMSESEILSGPLEPTNEGYALAKLVGWKTVQLMSEKRNWRTMVLSNLYGPHDHFETGRSHLLAAIIQKVYAAKMNDFDSIEMWGEGTARREFTYVEDVASFIVSAIERLESFPDSVNIGAGVDYSVRDYYEMVSKAMNYNGKIIPNLTKPTGMERKLMNISKAQTLGWNPSTSIEDGIMQTVLWYENSCSKVNQ